MTATFATISDAIDPRSACATRTRVMRRLSTAALNAATQSTLRAGRTRLHDARDTEFVLKLFGTATDDAAAILDSCERFVEDWHHVDGILDRNPPKLVPARHRPAAPP